MCCTNFSGRRWWLNMQHLEASLSWWVINNFTCIRMLGVCLLQLSKLIFAKKKKGANFGAGLLFITCDVFCCHAAVVMIHLFFSPVNWSINSIFSLMMNLVIRYFFIFQFLSFLAISISSNHWITFCRYVSVGDVARVGTHPPHVAAIYRNSDRNFALPIGYDLVMMLVKMLLYITHLAPYTVLSGENITNCRPCWV